LRRPSIAVVDYGAGNLTSVLKGVRAAGADPFVTVDPARLPLRTGDHPGVGHFGATASISRRDARAPAATIDVGPPVLGICLGLQYLFDGSEEASETPGLGVLAGRCARLAATQKVPHVGWNELRITRPSTLLDGIADGAHVYFTHSYAAPVTDACVATTDYTRTFAAAVERDNGFAVQFHPEKSGDNGLRVLRSFVTIARFPDSPDSPIPR
jgi:glutamine amidotransferase